MRIFSFPEAGSSFEDVFNGEDVCRWSKRGVDSPSRTATAGISLVEIIYDAYFLVIHWIVP
jgi:hypothetical protein